MVDCGDSVTGYENCGDRIAVTVHLNCGDSKCGDSAFNYSLHIVINQVSLHVPTPRLIFDSNRIIKCTVTVMHRNAVTVIRNLPP